MAGRKAALSERAPEGLRLGIGGAAPGQRCLQAVEEGKLLVGAQARVVGDVVRRPDERQDAVHAWLLRRNARLPGVAFATDAAGDVYLVGRLPLEAVTPDVLDRWMGAVLATADGAFDELLVLGRAMSGDEVAALWRAGRPGGGSDEQR